MGTKPELGLVAGKALTLENLIDLFKKLTGREPTEKELAEAKAKLEAAQPKNV